MGSQQATPLRNWVVSWPVPILSQGPTGAPIHRHTLENRLVIAGTAREAALRVARDLNRTGDYYVEQPGALLRVVLDVPEGNGR